MNMLRKMLSIEKDQSHVVILVLGLLNPYKTSIIHPPAKEKNRENEPLATSKAPFRSNHKRHEISYNNEPKYVLPVRTAKQSALRISLCWCNKGSKSLCSIIPAST